MKPRKYTYSDRVLLVGETRARYISDEGVDKILEQRKTMRERTKRLKESIKQNNPELAERIDDHKRRKDA